MTDTPLPTPPQRFLRGLGPENPVFRQAMAICPTLAVTATVEGAAAMAAAAAFVLLASNLVVSLLRGALSGRLRLVVFTTAIVTFVTLADRLLAAYWPAMSARLGPYVPLLIANCLFVSRLELCASLQGPPAALADAAGQGLGHAAALLAVASVREILGSGSWAGIDLGWASPAADKYKWGLMAEPAGAFFALGLLLAAANALAAAFARDGRNGGRP